MLLEKFPSPLGVIFSLIFDIIATDKKLKSEFPSPLGVIFSLISQFSWCFKCKRCVSVSSRSYILSYKEIKELAKNEIKKFPSPLGVIFSLIQHTSQPYSYQNIDKFPSPLGVIFSLIKNIKFLQALVIHTVSVSSRSYILSYDTKIELLQIGPKKQGFRLLSELYSLLYNIL